MNLQSAEAIRDLIDAQTDGPRIKTLSMKGELAVALQPAKES